ncbi:UPF0481 protein At3g47200-like [Actinidia eriantha]|uniref:UPF0481 protein At3g47200-like n=1 Tax=Actinidia eriantha TaxID=165200 RepID=UPI00258866E1|nr:UPF0481 protein At3g47200-like [Actinidia eriantha]
MEDSLLKTIHKKISDAADKRGAHLEASIYRVPHELRNLKKSAYTPRLVSIGPFHSKNKNLFGQEFKTSYADSLLSRVTEQKYELLRKCMEEMEREVDEAKKCYSEQVGKLNAEMLLLDGCFVIEFLYKDYQIKHLLERNTEDSIDEANQITKGDYIFCNARTHLTVQHDLLLLENQLPFFVLETLFQLTMERVQNPPTDCTLSEYVISSLGDLIGPKRNTEDKKSWVRHLSSFCRPKPSMNMPWMEEPPSPWMEEPQLAQAPAPAPPPPPKRSMMSTLMSTPVDFVRVDVDSNAITVDAVDSNADNAVDYDATSDSEAFSDITWLSRSMPSTLMPSKMYTVKDKRENMGLKKDIGKENYHILHILHCHHLQLAGEKVGGGGKSQEKESDLAEFMHSASDLNFAGVKFVPGKDFFSISFIKSRGRFEIPTLRINDFTEPFLRNLIAFEQCCPRVYPYFTSFAFLMDSLINTTKDVEVLKNAGVIHNYLGTDENVSDLFNKLCKEVVPADFKFAETCRQADEYSKRCWPVTVAYVRRQYFANLWTTIAFLVAFIVFGITMINLVRSFL